MDDSFRQAEHSYERKLEYHGTAAYEEKCPECGLIALPIEEPRVCENCGYEAPEQRSQD